MCLGLGLFKRLSVLAPLCWLATECRSANSIKPSFFFFTLLFRLLSLAQEGQGWLKEGTVALASNKQQGFPPTT